MRPASGSSTLLASRSTAAGRAIGGADLPRMETSVPSSVFTVTSEPRLAPGAIDDTGKRGSSTSARFTRWRSGSPAKANGTASPTPLKTRTSPMSGLALR